MPNAMLVVDPRLVRLINWDLYRVLGGKKWVFIESLSCCSEPELNQLNAVHGQDELTLTACSSLSELQADECYSKFGAEKQNLIKLMIMTKL